ncbi:hypothetical protein DFH09DRAFT_1105425 [Mycena vulgaris]|nr:hypothetical protein DFH09DRAFT_1105425 [Mycena vulgaris]
MSFRVLTRSWLELSTSPSTTSRPILLRVPITAKMGGREAVIRSGITAWASAAPIALLFYESPGTSRSASAPYTPSSACRRLDTRHAFSGDVSLGALDPDPPPFLPDPPAPLSTASSPTAITDAVHETSALWFRRARHIDALTPRPRLRRGSLLCVLALWSMASTSGWVAPLPERPARVAGRASLASFSVCPLIHLPSSLHALWRASSPPSMTGVVHFAPSASARCREHTSCAPMPLRGRARRWSYLARLRVAHPRSTGMCDHLGEWGRLEIPVRPIFRPEVRGSSRLLLHALQPRPTPREYRRSAGAPDSLTHVLGLA